MPKGPPMPLYPLLLSPHVPVSPQIGESLLRQYVFVHLDHAADKFQLLLHMLHKLYALVRGNA